MPDSLRFPVAWAETGRAWDALHPVSDWRGLAYAYQAAGAPNGEVRGDVWLYTWNGRFFEPHMRIEPIALRCWGSLGWTVWWAWVPSMYAAVFFHAATTAGTTPITDSQFLATFIVSMCVCWGASTGCVGWVGGK